MGLSAIVATAIALASCARHRESAERGARATTSAPVAASAAPAVYEAPDAAALPLTDGGTASDAAADDRPLHLTTQDDLLALVDRSDHPTLRGADPEAFLRTVVGPGGPAHANQGNPEIAQHAVSRARCLEGLRGITLQTPEQKSACGDHELMVPIYRHGKANRAKACIDVFEYPNRPCELPFVWVSPTQAARLCALEGKRLCTQEEWVLACSGDPDGGKPWKYAYGNDLDLEICNTNKSAKTSACDADKASTAWKSCGTHTEPSGSFPRCRSRFGVFDMHGNVAEEMTRLDEDGHVYSQLKGSPFFYVDVARAPGVKATKDNYPDVCAHDPRWHVEPIEDAWHVNYHLGFRCCRSIR